jgi:hypothetical protein
MCGKANLRYTKHLLELLQIMRGIHRTQALNSTSWRSQHPLIAVPKISAFPRLL